MRSNQRSTVMPALVAGIHVFLARSSASKAWMAGTSPAMTPEKWFNMTGIRSKGGLRNKSKAQVYGKGAVIVVL
jgi:hypothetical protein